MQVQKIMTRDVVTVDSETDLRDVARTLVKHGITGVPVCGAEREVLGVVSEGDLLVKEGGPRDKLRLFGRLRSSDRENARKVHARRVWEAMTAPAVTISPYAAVAAAARRMSDLGIKRLPVVNDNRVVGIVSRSDLVRVFLQSDEEI